MAVQEAQGSTPAREMLGNARKWELHASLPPDFSVSYDEAGRCFRAEVVVFMQQLGQSRLKEVRVRGPPRDSVQKARKDGSMLKREAVRIFPLDPRLLNVRAKLRMLEGCVWRPEDLVGEDVEEAAERCLPELETASELEKLRTHEKALADRVDRADWAEQRNVIISGEWINPNSKHSVEKFSPVGPSWALAAKSLQTPKIPGLWYVHERQREDGRHAPWLFFNASNGQYFRTQGETGLWVQTGTPHCPVVHPLTIAHSSVCLPAAGGRKDDLAVSLPELPRTGSILKQPLPFLDKPAALFLLVDGLRESSEAAEFCAKRFHTQFMPRLSSRPTEWEDHELLAIVQEAVETLDRMLIESMARYAGCCLALALILGRRVAVCTLGSCRAVICRPPATRSHGAVRAGSAEHAWSSQALAGGPGGNTKDVSEAETRRLRSARAPLEFLNAGPPGVLTATSASEENLAAAGTEQERVLLRVARAAHPFAALGLRPTEIQAGGTAAVKKAMQDFEALAHPMRVDATNRALATGALARITDAAQVVEKMMDLDMYGTQLLAELLTMMDDERGILSPTRAANLLGLEQGCGEAAAMAAVDRRYRTLLTQLSAASPAISELVAHGILILEEAADLVARPTTPWTPVNRGVGVTRALGLRDLKRPRHLVGTEIASEILQLEGSCCIVLLTDSARLVTETRVGQILAQHAGHPRAACLRLTQEASASFPEEAVGAITMFINEEDEESKLPDPKKRRLRADGIEIGKPARARIGHILLKFGVDKTVDNHARRPAPPGRTQADAEVELLRVLEALLKENPKQLTNKFAEACRERSDCKSALTMPLADLGWVNPGMWGKEFDAAAFELEPGDLSDVIITPRGAHLLYRLA